MAKMFAYHPPTSPHFAHSPWFGVPPFVKLKEFDPDVVEQLNEMQRPELFQVLGHVSLATSSSGVAAYLACCPPSRSSLISMVAAAAFCLPMVLGTAYKKRRKVAQRGSGDHLGEGC